IFGTQFPLAVQLLAIDRRAVKALQVTDTPTAVDVEDFRVFATADIIAKNDTIGGRPAQSIALTGGQGKDFAKAIVLSDDQVCVGLRCHVLRNSLLRKSPSTGGKGYQTCVILTEQPR